MSEPLSEILGDYEQLGQLTARDSARDVDLVSVTNNLTTKEPESNSEAQHEAKSTILRAPPPSPAVSPKPNPNQIQLAPVAATAKPTRRIDIHSYCGPGAPEDVNMFNYLWVIRGYHGKTEVWENPTPRSQEIISRTNVHAMMMEARRLGGYDALDHNPGLWSELAFRLRLLVSKDQEDGRAKEVIEVIQRVDRGWLRPFEQYCRDWPYVPSFDKDALIAILDHNLRNIGRVPVPVTQSAAMSIMYKSHWPPKSLDPITPDEEPYIVFRLQSYSGPGIPADAATCFYLMKLWRLSSDPNRLKEAPPLPQPPPDASGQTDRVNYYNMNMAINSLGGPDKLLHTPGLWVKLAYMLKVIGRDNLANTRPRQNVILLQNYFKNYLIYFGIFCDQWPTLALNKKQELIRALLREQGSKLFSKLPEHSRGTPGSTQMAKQSSESGSSESGTTSLLPPSTQWTSHPPVDLIAYNVPGVPKDHLVLNYFLRMWTLEMGGRLGPLPAWKGARPTISILHMHLLIDGYGGIDAMTRIPELWTEMAFQLKMVARWERGSDRMQFLLDTLKYVYRERLVPFKQFCDKWPELTRGQKSEHVAKLIKMLNDARSGIPPPPSPDDPKTILANALTVATSIEQKLNGFHSDKPFEERIQQLQMLLPEEAAQHGIDEPTIKLCQRLSEGNVKAMASVLAGAPSSSKPIQINTARTVGGSWNKAPDIMAAGFPQVANSSLWSQTIIQAANRCLQEVMKRINDSRATDLPRVEVPESERAKVKQVAQDTYPLALEFYYYAIFHIMIYARAPWTEFIMRQACLILEQHFFSHAGSSVFISTLQDAQFARRMLRDEVEKIKRSYASRALEQKSQVAKVPSGQVPPNVSIGIPSPSAKA